MQAVRFGKLNARNLLLANEKNKHKANSNSTDNDNSVKQTIRHGGIGVLSEEDTKLHNISIASLHPHYTPTLIHLECGHSVALPRNANMHNKTNQTQMSTTSTN